MLSHAEKRAAPEFRSSNVRWLVVATGSNARTLPSAKTVTSGVTSRLFVANSLNERQQSDGNHSQTSLAAIRGGDWEAILALFNLLIRPKISEQETITIIEEAAAREGLAPKALPPSVTQKVALRRQRGHRRD